MNKRRWLLHVFERAREPSPEAQARLGNAIRRQTPDGRSSQALLGQLDAPSVQAQARLQDRIAEIPERYPRGGIARPARTAGLLALAGAAGLVLLSPLSDPPLTLEPLATALEQSDTPTDLAPFPGVSLAYHDGYGELAGTTRSPEIQWVHGRLDVEVEPERGIELAVHTEEADIRVVGTRFSVTREDARTVVAVERGKVEVSCNEHDTVLITAGQSKACDPRTPARLLLRADRLRKRGAEPDEVLEVAERGLALAHTGDAAWSHLQILSMLALESAGRQEQALQRAESYLQAGHARRRDEVLRLAMGLSESPCQLAAAHRAMLESEQAQAVDLVRLSDCMGADEGEQARRLLVRALAAPELGPTEIQHLQQRLDRLRQ